MSFRPLGQHRQCWLWDWALQPCLLAPVCSLAILAIVGHSALADPTSTQKLQQFSLVRDSANQLTVALKTSNNQPPPTPTITFSETGGARITLPALTLASELVEQGYPVVIDNQNTTIGRATPQDDGSVVIDLPNIADVSDIRVVTKATIDDAGSSPLPMVGNAGGMLASHVSAAIQAAQAALEPGTHHAISQGNTPKPNTPVIKPAQSRAPHKTVSVKPAPPTKAHPLPKVVPLKPTKTQNPPPSEAKQPTPAKPDPPSSNQSLSPFSSLTADTSWFQDDDLPEVAGNAYGVLGVSEPSTATPPEPTSSWWSGIRSFLDNVSGNLFSRPYGVAFWGMVMAIVLLAGGGFVLLAIGLLLARVAFKPEAFIPPPHSKISPTNLQAPESGRHQVPANHGLSHSMGRYTQAAGQPTAHPPFRSGVSPSHPSAMPLAPTPQTLRKPSSGRSSLWQRLKAPVSSSTSPSAHSTAPTKPYASVPNRIIAQQSGFGGSAMPQPSPSSQAHQPKSVKDAVDNVLQWV